MKDFFGVKYKFLFITLLLLSFIIRFVNFEPLHYGNDTNVPYLVAHHIIKYHEFPLAIWNSTLSNLKSSPTYFYFVALLSVINGLSNHLLFLSVVNIFLQLFTIGVIFLLAKNAFGTSTALFASTLFSFSKVNLDQSLYSIWGPFVMQPFINLSYLLLLLTFTKRSFNLLLSSVFFFIFAGTLHNSAFSLLPLYLLLCIFILINQRTKIYHYSLLFLTVIFSFILFFFPLLIYWHKNNMNVLGILNTKIDTMYHYGFLERFASDTSTFFENFFFISKKGQFSFNMLVLDISLFTILFYLFIKKDTAIKKYYSITIVVALLWQFVFVGLIDSKDPSLIGPSVWGIVRYFTPILGLFVILIAQVINAVFSGNKVLRITKMILIILLLNTFSQGIGGLFQQTRQNFFKPKHYGNPAAGAIKREIIALQKKENASNLNFFQLRTYGHEDVNSYFWVVLERELDSKFVKISDTAWNSYVTTNDDKFIFLICNKLGNNPITDKECQDKFIAQNQNYQILSKVYSQDPFLIYLAKR